jgi:D-inositol-3-phosphate glycosyltransferase
LKRIVIIGSAYPLRGGLSAFNERLAAEFLREGHQVTIYTFALQYPSFLFPGKTQYSSDPPPESLSIKIKINSVNPFNWIETGRELKKLAPDYIIIKFWIPFMSPCFGTIARIAKRNRKTKVISILDNVIPHEKRPFDRTLIRYFVDACDGFIAMSKEVYNDLKLFAPAGPAEIIPHPVYDNFGNSVDRVKAMEHLKLDSNFHYILFFGFIRKYKGLDLLLEAIADERIKAAKIKLIVAGEFYEDAAPYQEIIQKHQLQDQLILATDFIPDAEVKYYFSAAELVVQPYKSATQSGISQIAYHFEQPMVVTDVGGLPEIVHDQRTGFVVKPAPSEIADAILRFFNGNYKEQMLPHIKEEKKKFQWSSMTNGILNLLK